MYHMYDTSHQEACVKHVPTTTPLETPTERMVRLTHLLQEVVAAASPPPPPTTTTGWVEILTTREVAAMLRLTTGTVRRLHRQGKLRAIPGMESKLLFTLEAVLEFVRGKS